MSKKSEKGDGIKARIYRPKSNGKPSKRLYADFRDYADVGGRQVALKPPGSKQATTDPGVAEVLCAEILRELEARRRGIVLAPSALERGAGSQLKPFASKHLIAKKKSGRFTNDYLGQVEKHLGRAVEFFGSARVLVTIKPDPDVKKWIEALRKLDNGRGGTLSDKTVRDHLNSLSNLYRRAQEAGVVPIGYNPPQVLMEKPQPDRGREAAYLEVHEAAIFLEACRQDRPPRDKHAVPYLYELVATCCLTGGRWSEVAGLMADDVNFERRTVTFRPNLYRKRLKTANAARVVPLWPQLAEILGDYVPNLRGPLLFPQRGSPFRPVDNVRKSLDRAATSEVCKAPTGAPRWKDGDIRSKMFRHTYCSARLQTLDHGHPVSEFTVSKELGHGGTSLVRRIYGHLGDVRHRAEVVEYRLENVPQELRKGLRLA